MRRTTPQRLLPLPNGSDTAVQELHHDTKGAVNDVEGRDNLPLPQVLGGVEEVCGGVGDFFGDHKPKTAEEGASRISVRTVRLAAKGTSKFSSPNGSIRDESPEQTDNLQHDVHVKER